MTYPRPDFERICLNWQSLNGVWDFIFDDNDVGRSERWHQIGLPERVTVNITDDTIVSGTDSVTGKAAVQSENLLNDNAKKDSVIVSYEKRKIQVPFVFQTQASGINNRDAHEVLWYERLVTDIRHPDELKKRLLLRFGAVDYEATVWIDGKYVGNHRGGHVPFDIDISDDIKGQSRLTIRVKDSPYDCGQPRGKQYWGPKPESIFYTPSSGIWQSVWLEVIPLSRIADSSHGTIIKSNDIESGRLHARVAVEGKRAQQILTAEIEASFRGHTISKGQESLTNASSFVTIDLDMKLPQDLVETMEASHLHDGVALWSPEQPLLYNIVIRLKNSDGLIDEVNTYTGMRSLDWGNENAFKLNGRPYFQALVLDQGYWPLTGLTPPSPDSLRADIELSKNLGFNGCRKHQKVEDPVFLYWADKLGYLVWGEAANGYWFNEDYIQRFDQEWMESVRRDINHPCIVTWTPVNESWGYPSLKNSFEQRNHLRSLYYMTKTLDSTRPVNDNCGWEHVCNDLTTFHDYSDGPDLKRVCSTMENILGLKGGRELFVRPIQTDPGTQHRPGAPVICTEFGGVNIKGGNDRDWGYTTASDSEDLLKRVEALMMAVVQGGHCCGFVYTQLTDIEQEVNGLYTFDREPKLDVEKVKDIIQRAQAMYYELLTNP